MGIRSLDNNRKAYHKEFLATAERLMSEVTAVINDLQVAISDQASNSKRLIAETHSAYESVITVLQSTINRVQRSITTIFHGPEILLLVKDIHKLFFNPSIPNNQ